MSHDLIWDGGGAGGTVPATPVVLTAVMTPHSSSVPQVPLLTLTYPLSPYPTPQEFLINQYGTPFSVPHPTPRTWWFAGLELYNHNIDRIHCLINVVQLSKFSNKHLTYLHLSKTPCL